jgi:hypothetical protein
MSTVIESASGLAAYKWIDASVQQPLPEQQIQIYTTDRGMVTVAVVPAGPHADDHTPTLARRREHVWSEVHDPFDTSTADVDERAGGNPIGNPHGPR